MFTWFRTSSELTNKTDLPHLRLNFRLLYHNAWYLCKCRHPNTTKRKAALFNTYGLYKMIAFHIHINHGQTAFIWLAQWPSRLWDFASPPTPQVPMAAVARRRIRSSSFFDFRWWASRQTPKVNLFGAAWYHWLVLHVCCVFLSVEVRRNGTTYHQRMIFIGETVSFQLEIWTACFFMVWPFASNRI